MKILIALFLCLPVHSFAQTKTSKYYIDPSLVLRKSINWNSPKFGAALNGGIIVKNFGIGAGIEHFKVYSDLGAATTVFFDLRYFFRQAEKRVHKLLPFAAADAGKMIWSVSQTAGSSIDNFTTSYDGNFYFALESGVIFSQQGKRGLSASLGFKSYPVTRSGIHRSTLQQNGMIGPLVETKYPGVTDQHDEVFLKIGYQF